MVVGFALIEGIALFAVMYGSLLVGLHAFQWHWVSAREVLGQATAVTFCSWVAFYYNDLYDFQVVRRFREFAFRLPLSLALASILFVALQSFFFESQIAGAPLFSSFLVVVALLLLLRATFYLFLHSSRLSHRVLVLGAGPLALKLIREMEAQPHLRFAIVGVVDDATAGEKTVLGHPLMGPLDDLSGIIDETNPDRIIVAMTDRRRLPVRGLLESRLRGIVIEDGVEIYEHLTGKIAIEWLNQSSLIFSRGFRKSPLHLALARGMSMVAAVAGLLVSAPILGLIALAIKLDSTGPVFFVQKRVGMEGKPFNLIKFRTMHPADGKRSEWVRDNGDQITRLGKWLRKFRLDELPQFVNVIRGDMNLVGPRPHPLSNFDLFVLVLRNAPECGEQIPYYSLRSGVRPGLTGWAQIRYGYANGLEEEIEKARYDLYYIKYMSFWFDLRILFDTMKVVFLGRGSQTTDAYQTQAPMGADAR